MYLGVYWYFGFPEGLYAFDYFKWKPGYGGHANNSAALEATVICKKPDPLIRKLQTLIKNHPQGFLCIYREGSGLKIRTGSFNLHDYDFLLMKKVEEILRLEQVEIKSELLLSKPELIRLYEKNANSVQYPQKGILKMVSSNMKKSHAECACLRMDCFIVASEKASFLDALTKITEEENISTLFYIEHAFQEGINLMIFFTNGRQGLELKKKQWIDPLKLENKIEQLKDRYHLDFKHRGGWDYYPKGKSNILKAVDEDYIF